MNGRNTTSGSSNRNNNNNAFYIVAWCNTACGLNNRAVLSTSSSLFIVFTSTNNRNGIANRSNLHKKSSQTIVVFKLAYNDVNVWGVMLDSGVPQDCNCDKVDGEDDSETTVDSVAASACSTGCSFSSMFSFSMFPFSTLSPDDFSSFFNGVDANDGKNPGIIDMIDNITSDTCDAGIPSTTIRLQTVLLNTVLFAVSLFQ